MATRLAVYKIRHKMDSTGIALEQYDEVSNGITCSILARRLSLIQIRPSSVSANIFQKAARWF